jgi:hypothetical protein
MLQIFVNKNFIVYIIIDSLIRPCLNIFKVYDFYSKKYVENEMIIYLNENTQYIFKDDKKLIELKCILFSSFENEEFTLNPDTFYGGKITNYKDKIKNGKCEFLLFFEFDDDRNSIISNRSHCFIHILIDIKKIPFKIKFSNPGENISLMTIIYILKLKEKIIYKKIESYLIKIYLKQNSLLLLLIIHKMILTIKILHIKSMNYNSFISIQKVI